MINAPISYGELFDKISILRIKAETVKSNEAAALVRKELVALYPMAETLTRSGNLNVLLGKLDQLTNVNRALWNAEDAIRDHERRGDFGVTFIGIARSIYKTNDERARIKREINELLGSELVEVKCYTGSAA